MAEYELMASVAVARMMDILAWTNYFHHKHVNENMVKLLWNFLNSGFSI